MFFTRSQVDLLRSVAETRPDEEKTELIAMADACNVHLDFHEVPIDLPTNEEVEEMYQREHGEKIPF